MAKQVGLFGLRGKIENKSFYKTTGVADTIIRGIPEGLSERVKTSEEYANTRLNNTEFGAACNVAGLLGQMVTPKFRPMVLPFSQSKMAAEILKVARQNTANWGQRVVTSADTAKLCDILSGISKLNSGDYLTLGVTRDSASAATVSASYTAEQASLMAGLGITGIDVSAVQIDLATGQWNPLAQEMATGYMYRKDLVYAFENTDVVAGQAESNTESMTVASFVPEANHAAHQVVVFVVLPSRKINNVKHILQEYCSFVAMPLPANA